MNSSEAMHPPDPIFMHNFDGYRQSMTAYYDQASHLSYRFDPYQLAREYDLAYRTTGSWMRDLARAMQDFTRGRRTLEIACGHGRWTRFLADSAAYLLATDASQRMLAQARQLLSVPLHVPPRNCALLHIDAFNIDRAPGDFDCAVSVNFFQHIPLARHDDFLKALVRKLGAGGNVLLAINRLRRSTRARLYRKPGHDDLFDLRQLPDGSIYEIIDNVFTRAQLAAVFHDRARNFRFHAGSKFDWVTFTV